MNDASPASSTPPPTQPSNVLLTFDHWANEQMFEACAALSDEQLDREFEMGLGTLRKTFTHMLGAMRGWTDVMLNTGQWRPRLEQDPPRSIAELRSLHDEVAREFRQVVTEGSHDEVLSPNRGGTTYRFSRGGIMVHVMTHSMHHRAQCLNMLRHLGVDPQPTSSVMQWMIGQPPQISIHGKSGGLTLDTMLVNW